MEDQSDNFILGEETGAIIGCAIEVVNQLGHGLLEKPYENALAVEFGLRGIPCRRQPKYNVFYKNIQVGEYIPGLIVFDEIVVEVKTIKKITNHDSSTNGKNSITTQKFFLENIGFHSKNATFL